MRKRSLGEKREAKRQKLDPSPSSSECSVEPGLLTLSDDVLLMILSYVDPPDLLNLRECSERLANICCDKTLWEKVELRKHKLSLFQLKKFIRFLQSSTKYIATRGPEFPCRGPITASFSRSFLRGITRNATNLTTLIIDHHIIDCTQVFLEDFPPGIETLALRNCLMLNMPKDKSYFYRIEKTLPKLKDLDLADNEWFVPHSLLALSKCPSLERLVLKGCDISDALPYTSLSASFGFRILRVLDLRHTFVSDVEVTCFNRSPTLRELYLQRGQEGVMYSSPLAGGAVTDFGMVTFGHSTVGGIMRRNDINVDGGVILVDVGAYPRPVCKLEVLVLRHYVGITDLTLNHAATSMKELRVLDISGTSCTPEGIEIFREKRPEVLLST